MEQEEKRKNRKKHHPMATVKKWVQLIFNAHFLLCFGFAWILTNGWAYALLGVSIWLKIGWMTTVASGYLAFIWFPATPEKILTLALSIFLLQKLFPKDEKTLGVLRHYYQKAKHDLKQWQNKRREKKLLSQEKKESDREE